MINKVIKASFCLTQRQASQLQKKTQSYKHLSNQVKRVEFEVLCKYNIPMLVHSIDSLPLFRQSISYNPVLTNGGYDFQQFPLIKILHIGLKLIEDNNQDKSIWSKFQNILKIRLHRCTTSQNMKLLYIMLSTWPFYRFKIEFITGICIALKKEIEIMNDQELRVLYRIVTTGWNQKEKFSVRQLVDLEKYILRKVVRRWEERLDNIKNRQLLMDGLYMWINLTLPLSLKNDLENSVINRKSLRIAELFSQIYQKATNEKVVPRLPKKQHFLISLHLLSIFNPVLPYYFSHQFEKDKGEQKNWTHEFSKLKDNILSHSRTSIERQIKETNDINTIKWILSVIDGKVLENILEGQNEPSSKEHNQPQQQSQISKLIDDSMRKEGSVSDKLSFISEVLRNNLITWEKAQIYYQTLSLETLTELTLQTALSLLQIQLIIYTGSNVFKPNHHIQTLLLNFISKNELSFRNFDWLAFHYLKLSYFSGNQNKKESQEKNIKLFDKIDQDSLIAKLINKLISELKQADASKLIEEQKKMHHNNPHITSMKKFFIEVRLHQMNILEPIIPYFQRLPHFSNSNKKIVVNAYSKQEITCHSVLLQKKLLNDLGWKVINLQLPDFLKLTLSQRIQTIGKGIKTEQLLLTNEEKKIVLME